MAVGLGVLALPPSVFWTMTPKELDAAIGGRTGLAAAGALSKTDLAQMMRRFPD